ncbi:MAG: hypothetical protein ACKV2T_33145 [Kofleriaceae bacterium]
MTNERPTKKLPVIKSTTYSVTNRRDAIGVTVDDNEVTISMQGQTITTTKTNARRLVAMLLEKLG